MDSTTSVRLPRVVIQFCVQCKWNLRAAYFAQELLQTFSTTVGEVSLTPVTGGIFTITLYHLGKREEVDSADDRANARVNYSELKKADINKTLIWDRKRDGGFPETKELKNRIRNVIDPHRDMGHVDRALKKDKDGSAQDDQPKQEAQTLDQAQEAPSTSSGHVQLTRANSKPEDCEECKEAS